MRIAIATDAWSPQVNGVVRTLTRTVEEMRRMGHEVEVISPDQLKTFPLPTYPERITYETRRGYKSHSFRGDKA